MQTIAVERPRSEICVLALSRPDRLNAINLEMYEELEEELARIAEDRTIRVVVLTGSGRGFCSGQDLKDLGADAEGSGVGRVQFAIGWQERAANLILSVRELPQPVIAAVNGAASGAGLALALAADTRLAAPTARFNAAFVRIGLSGGDMGVSYLLPRAVGATAAAELMLTGRMLEADEALRIGLVLRVEDDVVRAAVSLAEQICGNSPFGVRMTKQVLQQSLDAPSLRAAMALENRTQILASLTDDADEAVAAFLERRSPTFRDH